MIPGPQYRRELFAVMEMGNPLPKRISAHHFPTHQKRDVGFAATVLAKSRVELQHRYVTKRLEKNTVGMETQMPLKDFVYRSDLSLRWEFEKFIDRNVGGKLNTLKRTRGSCLHIETHVQVHKTCC